MPIRRDDLYHVAGERLPATTAIIGILDRPYLRRWAARVAAEAVLSDPDKYNTAEKASLVPDQYRDDAAGRGKAVHAMIEAWGRGRPPEEASIDRKFEGYRRGFLKFLRTWRPEPLHVEVVVYNLTHKYAGTVDLIARIGDAVWLLDFKTGKSVYFSYELQTVAYRHTEHMIVGGTPQALPEIDSTGVVLLRDTGTFEFKETAGDFELFLALKEAYMRLRAAGQV
jgi:hypothetical protein